MSISFFFNFSLLLCELHITHPSPTLLIPSYLPSALATSSPKIKKIKYKTGTNKTNRTKHSVPHRLSPVHTSLSLANVHCSESLVRLQISDFCDPIDTGTLLCLLLVALGSPWAVEILQLDRQFWPFHMPNSSQMLKILE